MDVIRDTIPICNTCLKEILNENNCVESLKTQISDMIMHAIADDSEGTIYHRLTLQLNFKNAFSNRARWIYFYSCFLTNK